MAMTLDTAIKFTAKLEGQGLDQLKRGLQGMAQQANRSSKDLDRLYAANKKLAQAAGGSLNSLQRQITVMTNLRNEAQIGSRQFKFYTSELEKLQKQQAKLDGAGAAQGGLLGALGGLRGGLAGAAALAGTLGVTQIVSGIATASMDAETARVRLQALTDTYGEYNQAQQATARLASTLRISNTEATDSFAKLYAGLRPTGVSLKELEQIFIGFNVAARTSGATAEETSAAMIQLKQALVSGRAQGDELRSILEQAPALGQAVAEQMTKLGTFGKVTRAQLKDLGAEGAISTDVLIKALQQLGEKELPKLEKSFGTGKQAVTDLGNATEKLQVAIGDAFGPIAVKLIQGFTSLVNGAADAMERFNKSRMSRGEEIAINEKAFRNAAKQVYGDEMMGGLISFLNSDFRAQYEKERQRLIAGAAKANPGGDQPTADQREAREAAANEREAARAAARKKALEDEVKIRQDAEEKLADAAQRNAEQIADFQRETIKRAMELERDLADERLKIERQIGATRRKIAQQEEDFALEAEKQRLRAAGLSTEGIEAAQRINEIYRQFTEERIENEQNAVDRQTDLQRRLEQFKLSVAEGIGKIQEGYARSVSNILQDAGEKLAEKMKTGAAEAAATLGGAGGAGGALGPNRLMPGSVGRGQLKVGQLKALAMAAGFNDRDASIMAAIAMAESGGRSNAHNNNAATGDNSYGLWQVNMLGRMGPQRRQAFGIGSNEALFDPAVNASAARKVFESQGFGAWSVFKSGAYRQFLPQAMRASAAPMAPALPPAAAVPGFNSAGVMGGLQSRASELNAAIGAQAGIGNQQNLNDKIKQLRAEFAGITGELDGQTKATKDQLADTNTLIELHKAGLTPELAQQALDLQRIAMAETAILDTVEQRALQELTLNKDLATGVTLTEQERRLREETLRLVQERRAAQPEILAGIQRENVELAKAEQRLSALQEMQEKKQRAIDAFANSIGNGLGQAFDLLATGTDDWGASLKEIASGVLKDIAKQLFQIYVIEAAIKALKGIFSAGTDAAGNVAPNRFANGGIMTSSGPAPLKKYSQGGIANRPQLALYGEGSKPEAYVPLPDGRRIPVALQGQDKMREAMGAGPTQGMGAPVLNMSFQSTNIGGVEYVSRDQLEAAMAETRRAASRDGAKRGMTMTLDKLQQSPSTRTRVGLR
jgi:tape measure domain-containing protein